MRLRHLLLTLAALAAFSVPAYAQDSEISGGGGSSGSGTVGPGTAGNIPIFASSTTISDSTLSYTSNVLSQINSTSAQRFDIYNTFTSATSYEKLRLGWATNIAIVGTEKGSGGGSARALDLQTDGTTRVRIGSAGGADFGAGTIGLGSAIGTSDASLVRSAAATLETTATSFQLGGTSSAFPMLKRSSSVLQARLADDSAFASFSAGTLILNGGTSGTVTFATVAATGTIAYTLPPNDGNASDVLTSDGSGVLTWTAPATAGAATWVSITSSDSPYTPGDGVRNIIVDTSGGNVTITPPAVSGHAANVYQVKKTTSDANAVIFDPNSTETVDGATTFSWSAQYGAYRFETSGSTGWHIF